MRVDCISGVRLLVLSSMPAWLLGSLLVAAPSSAEASHNDPAAPVASSAADCVNGSGAEVALVRGVEVVAPVLGSVTVDGAGVVLAYGRALDGSSVPAGQDFEVSVRDWETGAVSVRPVGEVSIDDNMVSLTLDAAVRSRDVVAVSYWGGSNPIRGSGGLDAATLDGCGAVNDTVEASDASLAVLELSGVELSPRFVPAATAYTASVDDSVTHVTVRASATDLRAWVFLGDSVDVDGDPHNGHQVALAAGANTITATVTAEDSVTASTYTVTVTRGDETANNTGDEVGDEAGEPEAGEASSISAEDAASGALGSSATGDESSLPEVDSVSVRPIRWSRFDNGVPAHHSAGEARGWLLTSLRYALNEWWFEFKDFDAQDSRPYLDFSDASHGGSASEQRYGESAAMAVALAVALQTGSYDESVTGVGADVARRRALKLVQSLAYRHHANAPAQLQHDSWGNESHSVVWAAHVGYAAWLLWADLSPVVRRFVKRMIIEEASEYRSPLYYRDRSGDLDFTGSKAEYAARNAVLLSLAAAMMPEHADADVWESRSVQFMLSAYSRPVDTSSSKIYHGHPLKDWLGGSNINGDGTATVRGVVHPDYMAAGVVEFNPVHIYHLAGQPTPQAARFNADKVMEALIELELDTGSSTPNLSGPILRAGTLCEGDGATECKTRAERAGETFVGGHPRGCLAGPPGTDTNVSYPDGSGWSTKHRSNLAMLAAQADVYRFDTNIADDTLGGGYWFSCFVRDVRAMQARHLDGRTWNNSDNFNFAAREGQSAYHAAQSWTAYWIQHQLGIAGTRRLYKNDPTELEFRKIATIEAEDEPNTLGGSLKTIPCDNCSGGNAIALEGTGSTNALTIPNIQTDDSGIYRIYIIYDSSQDHSITLNLPRHGHHEPAEYPVSLPALDRHQLGVAHTQIHLDAGDNDLTIFRPSPNSDETPASGGAPAIDRVILGPPDALSVAPTLTVAEGTSEELAVTLLTEPSEPLRVTVDTSHEGLTVTPATLTFTTANWETVQTVEVTADEDPDTRDDSHSVTLAYVWAGSYPGQSKVAVRVRDDDTYTLVAPTTLRIAQGSVASLRVRLSAQPSGDVAVTATASNTRIGATPAPLTFTSSDWRSYQTLEVWATDPGTATLTLSYSGGGADPGHTQVAVTVTETRQPRTDTSEPEPDPSDTTAPQLSTATVDGTQLVLTYSETLDTDSTPSETAFAVSVVDSATAAASTPAVSSVDVSGAEVTLTLATAVRNGDTVAVTYTVGDEVNNEKVIQDTAGLNAATLATQAVTNNTAAASDATLSVLALADVGGTAVALSPAFGAPEDTSGTYTASVANEVAVVTVTAATTDSRASLTLPTDADAVTAGVQVNLDVGDNTATLTVTAEDSSTTATYTVTVTRADETDPPAVDPSDTTAPALASATVDGDELTLTYSETLDTGSEPAVGAFSVSVTDSVTSTTSTPAVSTVEVTGADVVLTLAAAVRNNDTVTVSYTVPDEANGEAVIEDLAGLNAAALASQAVTNVTAAASDATLSALALSAGADALSLTPAFDAAETTYSASVVNEVTSVTVTAAATDSRASVALPTDDDSVTGGVQVNLTVGANAITVTVTAEDGTTGAYTVTVSRADETDPPQLTSATVSGAELTLTYSETLDSSSKPATSAFAVSVTDSVTSTTSTPTVSTVDVSGAEVTLTLAAGVRNGDTVTVSYTVPDETNSEAVIQDTAGLNAAALSSQAVTNNTAAAADATLQTLALADADGTAVALSPVFGSPEDTTSTYTAQVVNEVAVVTVTATGADDRAGVVVSPADADTDTAHHQAALAAALTEASDTTVTVTVTAEDTTTTRAYTITVTSAADTTAPSLASATVDGTELTLTYSEALDTGSEPAVGAFSVSVTDSVTSATSTPAVSDLDVTGADVVLTLGAAVRYGDTVTVSYTVPDEANNEAAIQDTAALNAAALASQSVTNATAEAADATLAALAVAAGETALTLSPAFEAAETTYSASVAHETTAVTVTAAVTDSRASVALPDDDDSVTEGVQVDLDVGANTVTVTVTAEDGSTTGAYTVTVSRADETDPPQLSTAAVDAADLVLTYSEALDAGSDPAAGDFAVTVVDSVTSAEAAVAVTAVDVDGSDVELTLATAVRSGDTVTFDYTPGTDPIQDAAANPAAALDDQAATNTTAAAADATLQTLALADAAGTAVALSPTFGSPEDTTGTYTASVANEVAVVTVTATGVDDRAGVVVSPVDADTDTEHHQAALAAALTEASDTTVTVTVTAEDTTTTGTYTITVTRAADTTAPSLASATVDGDELTLTYSEALDTGSEPAVSAFSVTVDDSATAAADPVAVTVTAVAISGVEVTLTLAAAVRNGDTVEVTYVVPDEANNEAVIEDLAGLNAAALSSQSVTNATAEAADATLSALAVAVGGTALTLTPVFDAGESTYSASVTHEVQVVTVTAAVADSRASLTLPADDDSLTEGVQVDLDVGANTVAVTVTAEDNTTGAYTVTVSRADETDPPQLSTAAVDAADLVLTYSEALDAGSKPATGDFAVTVVDSVTSAEAAVAVTAVDVDGSDVELTLAAAVRHNDTVTFDYTPGTDPIQDAAANPAAALDDQAATNTTAAASDATLQALALADAAGTAVALSPVFGSVEDTTGTYTAQVANEVAVVTVTATGADDRAGVVVSPVDADTDTEHHQAALAAALTEASDTTVTVTVTAEDTTTTGTYTVTVTRAPDTTAPSLASATVDGTGLTLTYSETLDTGSEPATSAFSVSVTDSVTATTSTPAVSDVDVTGVEVTLTLGAAVRYGDTVTVSYTVPDEANSEAVIEDLAGLNAAALSSQSVTNATAKAADATLSALAVAVGETALTLTPVFDAVESTYSASVTFEVQVVTVTAAVADSRASLALPTDDDTVTEGVQVDLDVGANTVTVTVTAEDGSTTGAYTVTVSRADETNPPQLSSAAVDGADLTLTYSEALDEDSQPAAGDFAVSVTDSATSATTTVAVSTVNIDGSDVELTLATAVRHDDTVTFDYTAATDPIKDLAGNNAAALDDQAVTNNTAAAADAKLDVLALADAAGAAVALSPVFGSVEDTTSTYTASVANEVAVVTVTATGVDDRATVVIAPADADTDTEHHQAALAAALTEASDTTITTTVTAEDTTTTGTYTVTVTRAPDTTAPSLSTATVDGTELTLTYSAALDTASEPAVGAFSVSVTDSVTSATSTPAVSDVDVTGAEVTLTLGAAVRNNDTVAVSYTVPDEANSEAVIQDTATNNAAALSSQTVTNNTAKAADATLAALAVAAGETALSLSPAFDATETTYSASVAHETTAVTVAATTTDSRASVTLPTDDDSLTEGVQVNLTVGDNTVTVTVTAEDGSTTSTYTVTVSRADETDPPQLSSAAVDAADLTLVYSEALDEGSEPVAGDFAVTVVDSATSAEAAVAVTAVDVDGADVELTLAAAVRHNDTVTFDYTPGTNPIKDLAANPAAALDDQAVTNNTAAATDTTLDVLALADADGTAVALSPVFGSVQDTTSTYTASVANEVAVVTVTATGVDDRATVVVAPADADADTEHHQAALDAALTEASTTTVTVTVTAEDTTTTGTYTIAVTRAPDTTAPSLSTATVDGDELTLTYSETLDADSVPDKSAFGVSVTDSVTSTTATPAVSDVDVTGVEVTLTLAAAVRRGDTVTVSYTVPDEANSEAVIQDTAALNAAALSSQTVTNNTAKAADATLAALAVAAGETALSLSPAFDATETTYSASVAHETTAVTVAATTTDSRASVTLPTDDDSLTEGVQVNLDVGDNTVSVTVTAEDGSTTSTYTVTVSRADETDPPQLSTATVDGTDLTLTYNEALNEGSKPAAGDFAVSVTDSVTSAVSAVAVTAVNVDGSDVELTLGTAVRSGDTVTFDYTPGTDPVEDLAANDAASLDDQAVTNNTAAASDATLDVLSLADAGGAAVALSPVFGSVQDITSTYTAQVANEVAVVTVTATGADTRAGVVIAPADSDTDTEHHQADLAAALTEASDTTVTVTVTAEDTTTTRAYTITVTRAPDTTAPSLSTATVDGTELTLTYSEALDTGSEPATSAFSVSVTDSVTSTTATPAVSAVDVTGADVKLTLAAAVRNNDTVAVSYTVPDEANSEAVIQDTATNNAAALSSQTVTNNTAKAADATLAALAVAAGADDADAFTGVRRDRDHLQRVGRPRDDCGDRHRGGDRLQSVADPS